MSKSSATEVPNNDDLIIGPPAIVMTTISRDVTDAKVDHYLPFHDQSVS
jgi:hypothetical protein